MSDIKLPEKLTGSAVMFLDGKNGMHEQMFRNEEYGLNIFNIKESRDHNWKIVITVDAIPNKEFSSLKEIKEYVASSPTNGEK